MKNSFLQKNELIEIGFKSIGNNVLISRFAQFYEPEKMIIGNNVRIDDFCVLSGSIRLGNYIHISAYTALYGRFEIELEDFSGLSPRCTIFSATDDFSGNFLIGPMVDPKFRNILGGKVLIKKYSQLGANSVVLPKVTIQEGVSVGAMSLVIKDLIAWKIYAGIPVRELKDRSNNLIKFVDN